STISAITSLLELYCFRPWVVISTREPEDAVLIVEPVMDPPSRVNEPAVMSTIVAPRLLYCFKPLWVSSTREPLEAVRIFAPVIVLPLIASASNWLPMILPTVITFASIEPMIPDSAVIAPARMCSVVTAPGVIKVESVIGTTAKSSTQRVPRVAFAVKAIRIITASVTGATHCVSTQNHSPGVSQPRLDQFLSDTQPSEYSAPGVPSGFAEWIRNPPALDEVPVALSTIAHTDTL